MAPLRRPAPSYNVTRNYVSYVRLALQSGNLSHARIDASIPLRNSPELLANYWRTDFDRNPTATDANGDSDLRLGRHRRRQPSTRPNSPAAFGPQPARSKPGLSVISPPRPPSKPAAAIPASAATAPWSPCMSTGKAAKYAPLLVYVQKQSDGTQTLTLYGKTSDSVTNNCLAARACPAASFASDSPSFRQTMSSTCKSTTKIREPSPIQDTLPPSTSDRYLTLYSDTSSVRVRLRRRARRNQLKGQIECAAASSINCGFRIADCRLERFAPSASPIRNPQPEIRNSVG